MLFRRASGLCLFVDFYGLDAKEYLSINRNEFKSDRIPLIRGEIKRLMQDTVDFLLEQQDIPGWVQSNAANDFPFEPDCYFILWQIANSPQRKRMLEDPLRFLHPMTETARILKWVDNIGYEESGENIGSILGDIQNYAFFSIAEPFMDSWELFTERTQKDIIATFGSAAVEFDQVSIILEPDPVLRVPEVSANWLWCSQKDLFIYRFGNASAICPEMSEKTQKNLFRLLNHAFEQNRNEYALLRYSIPVLDKYRSLAVNRAKSHTSLFIPSIPVSYCIIFPCLSNDDRVKRYSKQEFISYVMTSPEFNNLANYVLENRADPTPCTKEDIIEAYKRLLSEYYDVMHEDETVKEESGDE